MRKILLVDDDSDLALAFQPRLNRLGQVFCAPSIEAARELMGRVRFDLFLVDLHLPDGRGDDLFALTGCTPTVLITGDLDGQAIADASGVRLLHKPVDPANLAALLEQVLAATCWADVEACQLRLLATAGELASLLTRARAAHVRAFRLKHAAGERKQAPNLRVIKGGKSGD